ncbi:hypothetical protein ACFQH8_02895 [Halomicroarcula sp. GCM10025710]
MPLADHVEEMAIRLFTVVGVMAAISIIALPASDEPSSSSGSRSSTVRRRRVVPSPSAPGTPSRRPAPTARTSTARSRSSSRA